MGRACTLHGRICKQGLTSPGGRGYSDTMTTNQEPAIIKAAHYGIEEARIAEHPITQGMYDELPQHMREQLAEGAHLPDFMTPALREWNRRADVVGLPNDQRPAHIGAVETALRIIARR